jgi:hypothetical protein
MKNIKTIETFLLEALRDTWRETIEDKDEFFGLEYSENLESKLIDYVHQYVLNSDWHPLKNQYFEDYDEEDPEGDMEGYIKNRVEVVLQEIVSFFKRQTKQDIIIYREIDVNDVWLDLFLNKENEEVHLGEYWAYDESGVDTYWGNGRDHRVSFVAKVKQIDINWLTTFEQNVTDPEECEINLFPNTPLELISITIDDEEVDLSNFKNKEIYA